MAVLRVRVRDVGGLPVANAAVVVARSTVAVPELPMLTDDDGWATLVLPCGEYELSAHARDGRFGTSLVTVRTNDETLGPIEVTLGG